MSGSDEQLCPHTVGLLDIYFSLLKCLLTLLNSSEEYPVVSIEW